MIESAIQAKILRKLEERKIYAHKNITTNKKGIPDIITCYGGRYAAFEVKSERGKPTELQLYNIAMIRESGGVAAVVRSWEEVEAILRRIDDGC